MLLSNMFFRKNVWMVICDDSSIPITVDLVVQTGDYSTSIRDALIYQAYAINTTSKSVEIAKKVRLVSELKVKKIIRNVVSM